MEGMETMKMRGMVERRCWNEMRRNNLIFQSALDQYSCHAPVGIGWNKS